MGKHAETHKTNAMAIMARVLLCAASVLGGSGCLFPQSDQVLPTLPPVKNRPPRIVDVLPKEQPLDFISGTVPNSGGLPCDTASFSLVVDDPDLGDTIRSIWFIDKTKDSLFYRPNPVQPGTDTRRNVTQPSAAAFRSALSSLPTGTHLVTVYVVDTDFAEIVDNSVNAQTRPVVMPDGSEVQDNGYVDQYTWVLNVGPACQ